MVIAAVVVSPRPIELDESVDIVVVIEGAEPADVVQVCVSVAWPFEIDGRAMLCQAVSASSLTVSFRGRLTAKKALSTCQITVVADSGDGESCIAVEAVEIALDRRTSDRS